MIYSILCAIFLPWIGAILVWMVQDKSEKLQHYLAASFSIFAAGNSIYLLTQATGEAIINLPMGSAFGSLTFVPDGLGVFLTAIASIVGSLAVIFSINYMHGEKQLGRYYSLVLIFIGTMSGLVLSGSLLYMFIFWEITAICSYALISFFNDDPKAVAGGMKALIITQLGGVGLLIGALVAYAHTGSYQINAFIEGAGSLPAGVLSFTAFAFIIAAVAKSAQFPLHTWLPDAMEAPSPISALIHAATMVNAGVYLLVRFYPAFEAVPGWKTSVMVIGFLSALLAAIMALTANDLKRVLAYSTVSQLGYMVYAIGVGALYESQLHLFSHSIFKSLLFLSAGAVIHAVGTRDMFEMGGVGKKMPFVRLTFIIGALGLTGLPIANGFFSKELILEKGMENGPQWAYIGMLIGAGLTALYTLRMVWLVFYGENRSDYHVHPAGAAMKIVLGILGALTMVSWLAAGAFSKLLEGTLSTHHGLVHQETTLEIVATIFGASATYVALSVIAIGFLLWIFRNALKGVIKALEPLTRFSQKGLGFEQINQAVVNLTMKTASILQVTQTGQLNWNAAGIVGGLVLLLILVWSAA
ncbi:MAG: NADH-quinone oxidoreductase subunit L [Anaerolineales bacterium]|nr:NADH-quinone oxidoreductase subunit L [Anaerolineales bacterium]